MPRFFVSIWRNGDNVNITEFLPADTGACLEIYNYYIENTCATLEEEPIGLWEYVRRTAAIAEKFPFVVARDGAQLVGFAYLDIFNPRSAYRRTADLTIYVRNDAKRGGIGAALLAKIEELAPKYGITTLVSLITDANDASRAFHEKHGFVYEGTVHNVAEKFGKSLGVCYYRKPLKK